MIAEKAADMIRDDARDAVHTDSRQLAQPTLV
jgi:hypothetical protein